jgi:hypothetical protein
MEAVIFMLCLTLHNVEEALWLTDWRNKTIPNIRRSLNRTHFIFAVIGITILGYLAAGLFVFYPGNIYLQYAFIGFVGAMLLNAIIPHLLLTIIYRKYCPGVFTGFFLIIPIHTIILKNALENRLVISEVIIATLAVGIILLGFIQLFQILAEKLLDSD